MKTEDLRKKRRALAYEAGKLLDKCKMNFRDLSEPEEKQFNQLMKEIDSLGAAIGDGITSTMGVRRLEQLLLKNIS